MDIDNNKSSVDLLLLHVPKWNNFYNPFGYFVMNNVISYGTFSIADWADQNNYPTEIVHLGVEVLFQKGFRISKLIEQKKPLLIGMSCHWHYQVYDVCELARHIKNIFPETKIAIGGYTASIFAEDLMTQCPEIDYIIRGEAEVPMVDLLNAITNSSSLAEIPNISYRVNGIVTHHPISFAADKAFLEKITFCRMDLFPNYQTYLKYLSYPVYLRSYPKFFNYNILSTGRLEGYMVPVGRGCPVNCQYCGGGNAAGKENFGRSHTTLISPEKVIEDIVLAKSYGIASLYFPFDPYPDSDYYPRLFKMIQDRNLSFDATFESFGLPTKEFIDSFTSTFGKGKNGQIIISPETGDESLRRECKGYFYNNSQLMDILDYIEQTGTAVQISYSIGLPGETEKTLEQTRQLWQKIKKRYKNVFLQTSTIIDPDPESPATREGSVPGYTLEEIFKRHKESYRQSCTGWTYLPVRHRCKALADSAKETQTKLYRFKCHNFCSYIYYPFQVKYPFNRFLCIFVGLVLRLLVRPLDINKYL